MISPERIQELLKSDAYRAMAAGGEIFARFFDENEQALTDDYLDYLNTESTDGEKKLAFPVYCYMIMFKLITEIEHESHDNT